MHYIVAYDIRLDRRRDKVMNRLKDFGTRVQFSVFECDLDPQRLAQLKTELLAMVNLRTDRLHFYAMCETCYFRGERFGPQGDPTGNF